MRRWLLRILAVLGVLLLLALVIDVGHWFEHRRHLQLALLQPAQVG